MRYLVILVLILVVLFLAHGLNADASKLDQQAQQITQVTADRDQLSAQVAHLQEMLSKPQPKAPQIVHQPTWFEQRLNEAPNLLFQNPAQAQAPARVFNNYGSGRPQ